LAYFVTISTVLKLHYNSHLSSHCFR